jgi:hypothetical protein
MPFQLPQQHELALNMMHLRDSAGGDTKLQNLAAWLADSAHSTGSMTSADFQRSLGAYLLSAGIAT